MENNNNLIEVRSDGIFNKIKKWIMNFFKFSNISEENEIEFGKEFDSSTTEEISKTKVEQIKYTFSEDNVSKQKIEKVKRELDKSKTGYEQLYVLNNLELDELTKIYESQIEDTVNKLNEVQYHIDRYKEKLEKIVVEK